VQPLILQAGVSHLALEMAFNGVAIPALCGLEQDSGAPRDEPRPAAPGAQGVLEAAAARSVGRRALGLRPDIWAHHVFAVLAIVIVLQVARPAAPFVLCSLCSALCALLFVLCSLCSAPCAALFVLCRLC